MGGAKGRPMQAFRAGDIHIGFVDGSHFYLRREALEDCINAARIIAVALRVSVHENSLRTQAIGGPERHCGVDAKLARGVGCGGNYSTLIRLAADYDGLAFERIVEKFFDGDE